MVRGTTAAVEKLPPVSEPTAAAAVRAESPDAWVKGFLDLKEKVSTRADSSQRARANLEEVLRKLREAYQGQLMFLKELELERIDLQAYVHCLASARHNWSSRHADGRLAPNAELERRLADEERAGLADVEAIDAQVALLSSQATRLRELRDLVDRGLAEKRAHILIEEQLLTQCRETLERPFGTASVAGSGSAGRKRLPTKHPMMLQNLYVAPPGGGGQRSRPPASSLGRN